ncbi:SDR family oxidoreductase [Leifsonia sp. Root112D2]|uniref:SDR family oxidoreductase n=1 Tax=Leifsonia sp. Root112D2 TaxID=1736426 RepID=UPI0006FCFB2B|nr:SDR family oxidoreductase [Leifsonia sp. Root112D2]KQV07371.1 NAD(P)-dependent oxidoreductase [Leifsonia sp. Root112D2]
MSFVVTGATGHLGRLAVEALLRRGTAPEQIVAVGRTVQKLDDLAARGVRVAQIDYTRPETLGAAFEGAEALLLVSGSEVGQRVAQHTNVVTAAKAAGVARIVYTSAPHADTSELVLAPEHKVTEQLIRDSGIPFTLLRNNWYTENYVSTLEQARKTGTVVGSAGAGRVASATRADYADAAAVVLTGTGHDNAVYELSGDVAWSFDELAATIATIVGREVSYEAVTPEEHLAILTAAGLDEGTAGFVVALDGNIRDGALAETSGELNGLIGRPTTSLEAGLRAALGA